MRVSDFFFLFIGEMKRNYKMLLLVLGQIVFIFLSASFLFIAQAVIKEGVETFLNSSNDLEIGIEGNYKMLDELNELDCLVVSATKGSSVVVYTENQEEFMCNFFCLRDEYGNPSLRYNEDCTFDKSDEIYVNLAAAKEYGLKKGNELKIPMSKDKECKVTIAGVVDDSDYMAYAYISYDYYCRLSGKNQSAVFTLHFKDADQLLKCRKDIMSRGYRMSFQYENYVSVFDMIEVVVYVLFALIVVLGLNSFRNMCSVIMNLRQDFFVRCKINGIQTRELKLLYPLVFQVILVAGVIISVPFCKLFVSSSNEIASVIVDADVLKPFEITDCLGAVVSLIFGTAILWLKWILFGRKLNKGSLAEMIDVKE